MLNFSVADKTLSGVEAFSAATLAPVCAALAVELMLGADGVATLGADGADEGEGLLIIASSTVDDTLGAESLADGVDILVESV